MWTASGERDGDRDKDKDSQTDKQSQRQRDKDRQGDRQSDRQRNRGCPYCSHFLLLLFSDVTYQVDLGLKTNHLLYSFVIFLSFLFFSGWVGGGVRCQTLKHS